MTVIAYREGILAADTLVVVGYAKYLTAGRKVAALYRSGSCIGLAAVAGDEVESAAFLRWADALVGADNGGAGAFSRGEAPCIGRPTDGGVSSKGFIILHNAPNTVLIYTHAGMTRHPLGFRGYFADGAGAEVALGAMYAGCDAITAVRAAIAHTHGCGGDVDVVRFDREAERLPGVRS